MLLFRLHNNVLVIFIALFLVAVSRAVEDAEFLSKSSDPDDGSPQQQQRRSKTQPEDSTTATTSGSGGGSELLFSAKNNKDSIVVLAEEDDVSVWPFRGKNATKKENPSCKAYETCTSCSDASWCHWCDKGQACHVMGSVYGCVSGSSCLPKPDPDPPGPPDRNDTSGCYLHRTCVDCSLHSSHLCHWCGHDNACHAVGSVYGCVSGVDCYSNDRCMRKHPERIDRVVFTKIGYVPFLVIFVLASLALGCSSLCCCLASGIKGAYDDLADLASESTPPPPTLSFALRRPLLPRARVAPAPAPASPSVPTAEDAPPPAEPTTTTATDSNNSGDETTPANETSALVDSEEGHRGDDGDGDEYVRLVEGSEHGDDEEDDGDGADPAHYYSGHHRPIRHMQRMYNACVTCYLLSLVGIGLFAFGAVRYYPKLPEYSICNDAVAWKSLIDSLTAMKVTADFEILASVSNPNHFDVALDMGRGTFTHNRAFVGTFDIPPVTAEAMSVTDMLIVAHLAPDKWDALSLTTEYYRGKLVLHVAAQATIRVPAFADYSYAADLKDIVVHVNELSDRHLCACPDWSDAKNSSATTPPATGIDLVGTAGWTMELPEMD